MSVEESEELAKRVEEELCRKSGNWRYLLSIFLLATTPGIYNALHITVYVFMTRPTHHTCLITQPLLEANFTFQQILNVSSPSGEECRVYEQDYEQLAGLGYEQALNVTEETRDSLQTQSCGGSYLYPPDQPQTVTHQWGLVCERSGLVSLVQVAAAFGKFVGSFCFGIVADKFGRKRCFLLASVLYLVAGPVTALVDSFVLFLCLRFVLGLAGSAVYEVGYVLLSELTAGPWRSRLGCVYAIFYPVGLVLLALLAARFPSWRSLQLAISLPTLFILLNCWLLPESPRWLLVRGRAREALAVLDPSAAVGQHMELDTSRLGGSDLPMLQKHETAVRLQERERRDQERHPWYKKGLVLLQEVFQIFNNRELRNRVLICNSSWFVASLCYYVIALNGSNLTPDLYQYTMLNGLFEAPGYLLSMLIVSRVGRRPATHVSFLLTGTSLLLILAIPDSVKGLRTGWAMLGRLCVSSVFSFITLHTSELFPTSNRNTAFGMALTMSQIGSMSAPLLVQLGAYSPYLPSTVCGCLALVAAVLVLLLPETQHQPLIDTLQDVEKSSKVSWRNCWPNLSANTEH